MTTAKKITNDQVREIPFEQLFVSPNESRKTLDRAALKELANSIELSGVQEPLLVRPIDLDCMSGEPLPGAAKVGDAFEIVAGQRRFEASKLAGKASCPCIVREMTDDEARKAAIVSNEQREDLPPLERALAFNKLLCVPGATVESVATALAKSPSYVGRRLKLLDAIEPVREALKCGAIELGHALELARLSEKQQQDLLEYLNVGYSAPGDDDEDDKGEGDVVAEPVPGKCAICDCYDAELADNELTWANPEHTVCSDPDCVAEARRKRIVTAMVATRTTVAELRGRIARTELRILRDVPFPLEDEIPPMACTACPKRAAGVASLFADIAEDTCTDPVCLETKLRVWVKAQLQGADQAGRKLAMVYDGYAANEAGVSRWDCVMNAECASAEQAIWVSGTQIGHFVQICCDRKCTEHAAKGSGGATSSSGTRGGVRTAAAPKQSAEDKRRVEAKKAERAKLADKVKKENEYRARLFKAIAEIPDAQIDTPRIALLTKQVCYDALKGATGSPDEMAAALGWERSLFEYGNNKLETQVRGLTLQGALRAAALALVMDEHTASEYTVLRELGPTRMEQTASWLGIDVKAVRSGKRSDKPAKKNTAKPAKAKKSVLSATAKKRIAEAMKKRWAIANKPAKKGGKR